MTVAHTRRRIEAHLDGLSSTGGILLPSTGDIPDAVPPHGVQHHYAPLAWVADGGALTNLRRSVAQLSDC